MAEVVPLMDAAKIKSCDAWNDHKRPQAPKGNLYVTWERLNKPLDSRRPDASP